MDKKSAGGFAWPEPADQFTACSFNSSEKGTNKVHYVLWCPTLKSFVVHNTSGLLAHIEVLASSVQRVILRF